MGNRKPKIGTFTIDLLKGQGLPLKSKPGGIAIVTVTAAIPITIAMGMFSLYLHNKIVLSVNEHEIVRCQAEIGKLSEAVELQQTLGQEKLIYSSCLSEVKSSISRHTQWSPVLMTVIENMPDSVVLTSLEVKHDSVKRKVPKKDDPKKMIEIDVLARTLKLNVSGGPQGKCDEAVRDFRDRLRSSALLGPRLEKIRVSQKAETVAGQNVVSYEINCIFKPEL